MIYHNPLGWFKLLFSLKHNEILKALAKPLLFIALYTALMVFLEDTLINLDVFKDFKHHVDKGLPELTKVLQLLGFVLSLLLLFRTNTAYDRWWEGRKLWGSIVNDSRNLALKISQMNFSQEEKDEFAKLISYFAISAKEHLRQNKDCIDDFELNPEELNYVSKDKHQPLGFITLLRAKIGNQINTEERLSIEQNLNGLIDSLGGCERIRNTPIPSSYSEFFKKFIISYVFILPIGFVVHFQFFAIVLATFFFYILVSVEMLAEEIEDPFGDDPNDLPLDDICMTIQKNCKQILGHP